MERLRLIDVGARSGIDKRWAPFHDKIDVRAFEPDLEECNRLNERTYPYPIRFLATALGSHDGEQGTLHICRQPGCSSLLEPNFSFVRSFRYAASMEVVAHYPVTLNRLDTVCHDFQPDILKIDTQGTELAILQGARRLLDSTMAVELEVEFVEQYSKQALFSDVDAFMRSQGFILRALRRTAWRNDAQQIHPFGGQLIHGDALYLRHALLDSPKGHIILAAYRQFDLLAQFGATHLIPKESWLIRTLSKLLSGFPNRELRRLVDRLRPVNATDWHDPDFF